MKRILSWLIGLAVVAVRATCQFRVHYDPRERLAAQGIPHVFAQLHAHQVAAGMAADPGTCAMVSRSDDGEMIVPTLRLLGHIPIRGSAGDNARKGGVRALQSLIEHVHQGHPAILAVDGPRGPRGTVHKGIGMLAKKSNAAVLAVIVIPERRWILSKTWDRLQIPKPFTKIDAYLSEPIHFGKDETLDAFASRVEVMLYEMEMQYDPDEARYTETRQVNTRPFESRSDHTPSDRAAA